MPVLAPEQVEGMVKTGASTRMNEATPTRFKPGDAVIVITDAVATHTRLPRYARGKRGVVVMDQGVFSFNDSVAHGKGHDPQRVYNVKFSARELWGAPASEKDAVYLDMFDPYIEPA